MKIVIISFVFLFLFSSNSAEAIYDPLSVPNNKIGVHILFPVEIHKAKEMVNSQGDWGYVTIPIQAGDRDLKKWQEFMNTARDLHIIPLVRLATHSDYFESSSWKKPSDTDIVDFANFLNSLEWPVKNRYVIVFNEVNRGDEWQGQANPEEYARLLSYTTTVFKSKNPDFFIISSGMDNAAATDGINFNQYDYFALMEKEVPGIFNQIDGVSSHSYPNPAFSQPPTVLTARSISSFKYEMELIDSYTHKTLPVFITETGWTREEYSDAIIAGFFNHAITNVWNDSRIIAITPFLLNSGPGPFQKFSLTHESGEKNDIFKSLESYPKVKGKPIINKAKKVLGIPDESSSLPVKDFSDEPENEEGEQLKSLVKWLFLGP